MMWPHYQSSPIYQSDADDKTDGLLDLGGPNTKVLLPLDVYHILIDTIILVDGVA